jgi:hypothetical protein
MNKTYKYIDLSYLNEFSDNDSNFRKTMLRDVVNEIPSFISDVQKFFRQQEWENLRLRVHKFIAAVPFAGISNVLDTMRSTELTAIKIIEKDQTKETLEILQKHLDICIEAFSKALPELEEELNSLK